jgi:CrcB protein
MTWLFVAIGGTLGAPARYLLDTAITSRNRSRLPLGTLTINVLGSCALGALAATTTDTGHMYALLGTGVCGGFTTFSTFTWESLALAEDRAIRWALVNVAASLTFGLGAACLTDWLA